MVRNEGVGGVAGDDVVVAVAHASGAREEVRSDLGVEALGPMGAQT